MGKKRKKINREFEDGTRYRTRKENVYGLYVKQNIPYIHMYASLRYLVEIFHKQLQRLRQRQAHKFSGDITELGRFSVLWLMQRKVCGRQLLLFVLDRAVFKLKCCIQSFDSFFHLEKGMCLLHDDTHTSLHLNLYQKYIVVKFTPYTQHSLCSDLHSEHLVVIQLGVQSVSSLFKQVSLFLQFLHGNSCLPPL